MTNQAMKIVEDNISLVHFTIKKYVAYAIGDDDAYQMGCIGLIKAAESFDENKGSTFSTFAVNWIRFEVLKYYRSNRAKKRCANYNAISLNQVISDCSEKELEILDKIADHHDVEADVLRHLDNEELIKALNKLPNRQRKSLILYYIDEMTQLEIANILDCTQVTISREIKRGSKVLKQILNVA